MRQESIEEWFFQAQTSFQIEGKRYFSGAPAEALAKRDDLRENWLKPHPCLEKEEPVVSMAPGEKDGKTGFFVRTIIIYIP